MIRYATLIEALEAAPAEREFVTHWVDVDEHETVTFGEFRDRARAQAKRFHKHGLVEGDRVVLLMPQSITAMTSFAGAMLLGAVPAFLAYPNFKVEPSKYRFGLSGVTANLGAKLVVIDDAFPEELLEHVALGDGVTLVRAEEEVSSDGRWDAVKPSPDAIAFIQHSAGTTGLQKGVALAHSAVLRQIEHLAAALAIDGHTDRIYSWLPLYHDMGLIACFILPMVWHVPVVMQSPLEWVMQPESMLQAISDFKCTLAWMPNFAFQFVPRRTPQSRWRDYDLSSVRALINCSEPVHTGSMQEFGRAFAAIGLRRDALQSSYAMAENVFAVTQSKGSPTQIWADGLSLRSEHVIRRVSLTTPGAKSFTSSGSLLSGANIRILSEETGNDADANVGEILLRSDCLFRGYFNRPDLTSEAIEEGWYHTGDLGFLLDEELYVIGRKKDLLIIGGENIYPQDIETLVESHRAVRDGRSIAFGLFNPAVGTEEIVVVAEVEGEAVPASIEQEIRRLIVSGTGIAVSKILLKPPKWIVKSTAGKASRSATREKLLKEHPELNPEYEGKPV